MDNFLLICISSIILTSSSGKEYRLGIRIELDTASNIADGLYLLLAGGQGEQAGIKG